MMVLGKLLATEGFLEAHVLQLQRTMRARALACCAALEASGVGSLASWRTPAAGMFLWLRLPRDVNLAALLDAFASHGVVALPGEACAVVEEQGRAFVRLTYVLDEPAYEEAAMRLCSALKEALGLVAGANTTP